MKTQISLSTFLFCILFFISCNDDREVIPFQDELTIPQTKFIVEEFPENGSVIAVLKARSKKRGVRVHYELLNASPNDQSIELLSNGNIISRKQDKLVYPDREYNFLTVRAYTNDLSIEFQVDIQLKRLTVQNKLNKGVTPYQVYKRYSTLDSLIGKSFGGGIIAHYEVSKKRCFIAAPSSLDSSYRWGCNNTSLDTRSYAGDGEKNTENIMFSCHIAKMAATACDTYKSGSYSDWYLPSLFELRYIQENLYKEGIGSYGKSGVKSYWSSTGNNSKTAFLIDFDSGSHEIKDREALSGAVHPMRTHIEP